MLGGLKTLGGSSETVLRGRETVGGVKETGLGG